MTFHRNQPLHTPHPLPDDFSPELREIDAQLTACAQHDSIPLGLADRVFKASMKARMTAVTGATAPPRLRLVGTAKSIAARPLHQQSWARLAMAASFALACVVAIWVLQPAKIVQPVQVAVHHGEAHSTPVASTLKPAHASAASHYEENLGYLSETMHLTSDDFTHDLAMLVSRF